MKLACALTACAISSVHVHALAQGFQKQERNLLFRTADITEVVEKEAVEDGTAKEQSDPNACVGRLKGKIRGARFRPPAKPQSPAKAMAPGVLETKKCAQSNERYKSITEDVQGLTNQLSTSCTDKSCPRGEFAACVLRMAGHDFMDFKNGKGGADGCVDFNDPDNAGLMRCLAPSSGSEKVTLADVWEFHLDDVSLADFFVIAAEALMEQTRGRVQPKLDFAARFKFGRKTSETCDNQVHLPDPKNGCNAVHETFGKNMGMSARESAALMGVHTLGRARLENSGFDGWWSDPKNMATFNNNYYISLILKGWAPQKTGKGKMQWGRVGARTQVFPEMMLNTDMCLAYGADAEFAEKQDCCAWIMPDALPSGGAKKLMEIQQRQEDDKFERYCGFRTSKNNIHRAHFAAVRHWCCQDGPVHGPSTDCGSPSKLTGFAAAHVVDFALDEAAWIKAFKSTWSKATALGKPGSPNPKPVPKPVQESSWR